jgi:diguanylate cyclase (GGDEF)-like protein
LTGAGLFDLAILGFPGLLIFAAILGGIGVFLTLLFILIVQCIVIFWLNLTGIIVPHTPSASWAHLVFASVLLTVTGFSVFVLVNDIKRLMRSLQRENEKVLESQIKIQHLAHHDSLTNLPNRLFGEQLFEQKLKQCDARQCGLALFFIDLDNFKPVNDALGHAAGDQLLEQLTQRLSEQLNAEQTLIRFGGDEFLVLAPYEGDEQGIKTLAKSLIEQCASVFNLQQTHVVVSASLGIARAPIDGREFKHVCRKADIAMYKAKQNGRNTYHFYDDSLDHASNTRFNLLQLLRPALKQGQFELYYQPIVDLSNREISTVEALLRWPQADDKMIPPEQFIPVAESSGLINQIGQWVIE